LSNQTTHETLSIYGFKVDYLNTLKVEFNPKSQRDEGDVAFKAPSGYRLFLSWGPTSKLSPKLATTLDHAKYSIDRIKHGGEASNVDAVEFRDTQVNGHNATRSLVKLAMVKRTIFFGRNKMPRKATSYHIHCDRSNRYFVLYGYAEPEYSEEEQALLDEMIGSFACH
jgi:hypothetical protein